MFLCGYFVVFCFKVYFLELVRVVWFVEFEVGVGGGFELK